MKFIQIIEIAELYNNQYGPSDIVDMTEVEYDSVEDIELNFDWDWYEDFANNWDGNPYKNDALIKVKYYYDNDENDFYYEYTTEENLAIEFEEWESNLRENGYDIGTESLKEACIEALKVIGYEYNEIDSYDYNNYIKFDGEYNPIIFDNWCECFNWIRGVVLDDSEESVKMNDILDDHGYKNVLYY